MTNSQIIVEFLGIVRHRAGCDQVELTATCLQELWTQVGERFPQLEGVCVESGMLKNGFLASIDGQRFIRSSAQRLMPGDRVLLLSADAGG